MQIFASRFCPATLSHFFRKGSDRIPRDNFFSEEDLIEAEIEAVFQDEEDFDESSSSEIAANCPLSEKYAENEFKMDIKAKYPTRSDKFLTSVLMNGPNNQLIGLRETMFIAIKLNRSYILVRFQISSSFKCCSAS